MMNDYPARSSRVQPLGALWIMLGFALSRPAPAAEVIVVSTEDAISVWWDGQRVGSTPLELGDVAAGMHHVEFGELLDERTLFGQNMEVAQGIDLRVTVDLERHEILVTQALGIQAPPPVLAPVPERRRHPWPWLLGAAGVAGLGLGTGTWVQARSWEDQAVDAPSSTTAARIREVEVRPRQRAAIIEGAVGVVLVGGAGVLWGHASRQVGVGPQGVWLRAEF